MASAVGQTPLAYVAGSSDDPTQWIIERVKFGEIEGLENFLKASESREALLTLYRSTLREYHSPDLTLFDDEILEIAKLETRFMRQANVGEPVDENEMKDILLKAEGIGLWAKIFLLSRSTQNYVWWDHPSRMNETVLSLVLNEIKGCIQENPTKFALDYVIGDLAQESPPSSAESVLLRLAASLHIEFQTMPKTVAHSYFCDDVITDLDSDDPSRYPSVVTDHRYFLKRRCNVGDLLEVRDQAEVDRFQRIFNRIDFVLAWKEKSVSGDGVGILPPEIVQRIAKSLTWPQVVWELRDDEKAFDAEQNPIYRRALEQRQIANDTAKRILGSVKRASEGRVEELDGEPQQKRARTTENPQI